MRRRILWAIAALGLIGCVGVADAQSTANQTTPGYLTNTGCPSGQAPCWMPYGPNPNQYPTGATPVANSGTGSTGVVSAGLPAVTGLTNYICGFDVSAIGGTAAVGPISVTNLSGGISMTYELASAVAGVTLPRLYTPCIPAMATSTAISVVTTADGTASAVAVNIWGFVQ
jgi:hypothetical protein